MMQVIFYDASYLAKGYKAVFVEEIVFHEAHSLAGRPDAAFYHPDMDRLVITDLKMSKGIKPALGNAHPSDSFALIFQGHASIADTLYHRCGLQLNLYYHLIKAGGYLSELRQLHGIDPTTPCDVVLEVLAVHDDLPNKFAVLQYPVLSEVTGVLLDAWFTHHGQFELLRASMVQADAKSIFANLDLPDGQQIEDTILAQMLPVLLKNRGILPDDTCLPSQQLQSVMCPWKALVKVTQTSEGVFVAIKIQGEHCEACNAAAAARQIPVKCSPRVAQWCHRAFQAGLSLDDIEVQLFKEDHPQKGFVVPCPRPEVCWERSSHTLTRFFPSKKTLRKIEKQHKHSRQYDPSDEISFQKMLEATAGLKYHPLRKSQCTCVQANAARPVCMNTACISFRAIWMAEWQVAFLQRDHAFSTVFTDSTGQVNGYGYPLHHHGDQSFHHAWDTYLPHDQWTSVC